MVGNLGNAHILGYHFRGLSRLPRPLYYHIRGYHLADPPAPAYDNIIFGKSLLIKYSDPSQELRL